MLHSPCGELGGHCWFPGQRRERGAFGNHTSRSRFCLKSWLNCGFVVECNPEISLPELNNTLHNGCPLAWHPGSAISICWFPTFQCQRTRKKWKFSYPLERLEQRWVYLELGILRKIRMNVRVSHWWQKVVYILAERFRFNWTWRSEIVQGTRGAPELSDFLSLDSAPPPKLSGGECVQALCGRWAK